MKKTYFSVLILAAFAAMGSSAIAAHTDAGTAVEKPRTCCYREAADDVAVRRNASKADDVAVRRNASKADDVAVRRNASKADEVA